MKQTTLDPQTTKIKFIQEWTNEQFILMDKAIKKHFKGRTIETNNGSIYFANIGTTFNAIDELLGLAYTSTGIWACYGICNVQAWFDEDKIYSYEYFVIGEDGFYYAILEDKNENQLVIKL